MLETNLRTLVWMVTVSLCSIATAFGQTTAFTYQGRLSDNSIPATGSYDFEFRLFTAVSSGSQLGSTQQLLAVTVTDGVFTVQLDFGNQFAGANRFLDISVRPAGGGSFTQLAPRQQVTSDPYSIRSLNATAADGLSVSCVSCVTSGQIASVDGGVVTGAIPVASVPAGSASYIQNRTSLQGSSNFSISGDGTAAGTLRGKFVNATSEYQLDNNRVLSGFGMNNLFVGVGAGASNLEDQNTFVGTSAGFSNILGTNNAFFGAVAGLNNTTGNSNSFFGKSAGGSNTSASFNAFFGYQAGAVNSTGFNNSFFGSNTGLNNSTGSANAFFGTSAGAANITGSSNSFFGASAGAGNTTGDSNAFFGLQAGANNTMGASNAFFGRAAGLLNGTGANNAFFGFQAGSGNNAGMQNTAIGANASVSSNLTNATAVGSRALVAQSNSLVLGSINGVNSATADTNVGIGTTTPASTLHISGTGVVRARINSDSNVGVSLALNEQNKWSVATVNGGHFQIYNEAFGQNAVWIDTANNNVGISTATPADRLDVNGIIRVASLAGGGGTPLCRNASNQISDCSSSLRYKTEVRPFAEGLDILRRLRPITFKWKEGGRRDVGFGAEDVDRVEPLLTTRNDRGEIEGVKYGQLTTILVNAVKQQQSQIAEQQREITRQQTEIDDLKRLVCVGHPRAALCRSSKSPSVKK